VGVDACLRQLGGQIALFARPDLADRFGITPSGSLFIGPPGTGKTHLVRYLAASVLDVPLYHLGADEFQDDPQLVHAIFERLAPERAILFIDEIGMIAVTRKYADRDERRMLTALLTALDGLSSSTTRQRLWVIAATTPDTTLDAAITRSGRLGVQIEFALPSEEQRANLFRLYLRDLPHCVTDGEIDRLVAISSQASGADIRDWISQAAAEVLADAVPNDARDNPVIEPRHLEAVATRRGWIAAERPGRSATWATAVHEAAHATIAYRVLGRDALAHVKVGWGNGDPAALAFERGHFALSEEWAAENDVTSTTWPDHVAIRLAGSCAEEALCGFRGPGASHDIDSATSIIRQQLDYADPAFGPSRRTLEWQTGLDAALGSEEMRATAWHLVRTRFDECWSRTRELVAANQDAIVRLARALLDDRQVLVDDEIVALIEDQEVAAVA